MTGIPTEADEQQALVQWLRAMHIFHFAPVNENNTYGQNRKYAMIAEQKAKSSGKVKGVSDMVVMLKDRILFIELKRRPRKLKNGKLSTSHTKTSDEQLDFLDRVNRFGYAHGKVCYGAKEAVEYIKEQIDASR